MNCPTCGIKHTKKKTAHSCYSEIENAWGHFVILCYNNKDGITEECLSKFNIDLEYFREVKAQRELMLSYYDKLRD